MTSPDIAMRLESAGQLLVRSGIEIDRILGKMLEDGATVSANLPSQKLFFSRLVCVDPVRQHVLLSYSDQKNANTALLAARSVVIKCNHRGARYAFSGTNPRQAVHQRQPVIQLPIPTQMLALQHRQSARPMQVPVAAQLDCQLRMGILAFDAQLVDVSLDGRAFFVHEDAIPLCVGSEVEARIRHPQRAPLVVGVQIRHVIPVALPGGKRATRIACHIRAAAHDLEELIRLFIIDLL